MVKQEPGNSPTPLPTEKPIESMPSTSKKRKIDQVVNDFRASDATVGSVACSAIPHGNKNTPPRAPLPPPQTSSLCLDDEDLEFRQIQVDSPAFGLVRVLQEVGMGIAILPSEMRDYMASRLQKENQYSRLWRLAFQEGDPDTLPGYVPSWTRLAIIREDARNCFNEGHDEASWNMEVHHQLLAKIFRGSHEQPKKDLDFMACAAARPHESYLPQSSGSKMVNFCLYDNTRHEDETRQELARITPTRSINHTGYTPLQLRPIVLSITTAPPSGDLDATRRRVGEWHSAQWRFLESAVEREVAHLETEEAAIRRGTDEALRELGFIPGVIVQGHRWLFVFSTLEPMVRRNAYRTVLWTELEFGSTQTIMKSYQAVAGLRRLARWATDVYMPWFRFNCC